MTATAKTKTTVHHFSITGEAFTEIARNTMLSELPAKAYRMLSENLLSANPRDRGWAAALAHEILDGKKKLIGRSDAPKGLRVATERGAKGYLQDLRYIYAGRIRIGRTWWRPAATVVSFGPLDAGHAQRKLGFGLPTKFDKPGMRAFHRARVEFYLSDGQRVVEVTPEKKSGDAEAFVIFEPCGEPPFWWAEHRDATAALTDFLAAGRHLDNIEAIQDAEGYARSLEIHRQRLAKEEEEVENELRDAEDEKRRKARAAELVRIHKEVNEQANGDYIELTLKSDWKKGSRGAEYDELYDDPSVVQEREIVPAGTRLRVPRAPFVNWCLWRTTLAHLAPPWDRVSPSGMKMQMDDSYHTDWMVGAGFDLSDSYNPALKDASYARMSEIQEEVGDFEAAVLVTAPDCDCTVGTYKNMGCVMVLKDLSDTPENNEAIANARAVITENGGQLSHGAILARENGIPVMLVPDAVTRYPIGTRLTLHPSIGKITQHWMPRSLYAPTTVPEGENDQADEEDE